MFSINFYIFTGGTPSLVSDSNQSGLNLDDSNTVNLSIHCRADALQEDRGAPILPVSPAPKDQRTSYSNHTQFKIKTVEESLEILNGESDRKMVTRTTEPASALRLPVNKMSKSNNTQSAKVEDAYMQTVVSKFIDTPRQESTEMPSPSTTAPLSECPEDIETIDVFAVNPAVTEVPTRVENETHVSRKVEETPPLSLELTNENEATGENESTISSKKSLPARKNDLPDSPLTSESAMNVECVESVKSVESVGPKAFNLPPLIMKPLAGE